MSSRTEQEKFWAGEFGNAYIGRNSSDDLVSSNIAFFSKALGCLSKSPDSILEIGANIGLNLLALKDLYPQTRMTAIEVNSEACNKLAPIVDEVKNLSFLEYETKDVFELVLIKTVLIHINPKDLQITYKKIAELSSRYVLIAEYFNPTPVSIDYRGHKNRLFKRDFAGEFLKTNPDWKIRDYGFVYHGDQFPQDDITWFLLSSE